jgi:protein N-terminal methyltransferase
MPLKRQKGQRDFSILPVDNNEENTKANDGESGGFEEDDVGRIAHVQAAPANSKFYDNAEMYTSLNLTSPESSYWKSLPPTLDTMLGGFNNTRLPRVDIIGSQTFLAHPTIKSRLAASKFAHAVDCGAGIGRVTKNLLTKLFQKTDLVDPIESFNQTVQEGEYLRPEREAGKIGRVFTMGLQQFVPERGRYSVIWNQWCLGHLTDGDLVDYFKRCREGLVPSGGGVIVVKENLASGVDNYDMLDSSFTRTEKSFRAIFANAGLRIIHSAEQHGLFLIWGLSNLQACRKEFIW